jgi:hypothetical protein
MSWPAKLLIDRPNPGPKSGWLADPANVPLWWTKIIAFYATLGPFDPTFDPTFE